MLTGKNMSSFGQYNAGFILECRLWAFKFGILKTIKSGWTFDPRRQAEANPIFQSNLN